MEQPHQKEQGEVARQPADTTCFGEHARGLNRVVVGAG